MSRLHKWGSVFLSAVILAVSVYCVSIINLKVSAATSYGYVKDTDVNVRKDASTASQSLGTLSYVYVTVNGSKKGNDGYIWYNITNDSLTGYIRGDLITVYDDYSNNKSFEEQIKDFPESYKTELRKLHTLYPNWRFRPDKINITFDEAVQLETGRKRVQGNGTISWLSMDSGAYDWEKKIWASDEGGWYLASREVIKYYMDVRNFLNPYEIYTFMTQDYNPALQNQAGVEKIVKGTFLENGYSDENDTEYGGSYVKVIMAAAKKSGVNPYIIAATIIQEQGTAGNSSLISGQYNGYEGYYNFFNIRATGVNKDDVIRNGLLYAKNREWSTRSKAIIEGAEFCGNNYVKEGQNTYFYINYNIKNPDKIWHQYATAVHNAVSSGKNVSKTYIDYKDAELDFLIPVYKDMPNTAAKSPEKNDKLNNYYFNSLSVSGLTPTFDRYTYSYDLKVSGDTEVRFTLPEGASYAGEVKYPLTAGQNKVTLKVKSQTGYINDYVLNVKADKSCILYIISGAAATPENPVQVILRGDTNGDGKISLIDLANVQKHLLGIKTLTGNGFIGGDTNKDGKISLIDLANIQKHLLGIISLN